jgi:MFS family permease
MVGLAALAIGYVLSQFYRSFLAVLTPSLAAELGATNADFSLASGAWFIAFALSQFVVGVSLDRYGPKRTAATMMAVAGGGGALLFSIASAPWMITVAMILIGIGCSPVLMASVYIFARTFSAKHMAVLISSFVGFGSLGNVVGASPLAAAADAFGWRPVMLGLGVLTIVTAAAIFLFVRDPKREEAIAGDNGFAGYFDLLRIRALWLIIPLVGLNYVAAAGIRGLWAGPYLADVHAADTMMIGQVTLFMALAMVIGSFAYGPLDTLFGTRKWVAFTGNVIGLAALTCLAMQPLSDITTVTILLVIVGLTGSGFGLLMAHGRAFVPAHLTGRGVTLLNFFAIGTVGVVQFASGAVVTSATVPGQPVAAYTALFWFYAILLAFALVVYLFSRDAKPEKKASA